MIPKKIHYIWLGAEIPDKVIFLLEKNVKFCEGYEIKLWRENDFPELAPFASRAYKDKKWAFVSDYLRFKILRDEGGVYLDTDMELLRPLDALIDVKCFVGLNKSRDFIYCGVIGAVPHLDFFEKIIEEYDNLRPGEYPTSPEVMTRIYNYYKFDYVNIHPYDFFYPLDEGEIQTKNKIINSYAIHHWHESWRSYVLLRKILRRTGIIKLYHSLFKRNNGATGN
jgi:mannosyltransferase OCH1-like enzyme